MTSKLLGFLAAAFFLAACDPQANVSDNADPAPAGSGEVVDLQPLTEANMPSLDGELGCAFTTGDQAMLLIAMGNVIDAEYSHAAVNDGGAVETLQSEATGGYDGMVEGATFAGGTLTVRIAPGERRENPTEQVSYAATLTAMRAGGAERIYEGDWTCGP